MSYYLPLVDWIDIEESETLASSDAYRLLTICMVLRMLVGEEHQQGRGGCLDVDMANAGHKEHGANETIPFSRASSLGEDDAIPGPPP